MNNDQIGHCVCDSYGKLMALVELGNEIRSALSGYANDYRVPYSG